MIPVTSVKMFGKTIKVKFVEEIHDPHAGACMGLASYQEGWVKIALSEHEDDLPETLKTLTHEIGHQFAYLSGLSAFLEDDEGKEEKFCQDLENHLWPVYRALARLEAGVPLDAQDKRALRSKRVKAASVGADGQAHAPAGGGGEACSAGRDNASELP